MHSIEHTKLIVICNITVLELRTNMRAVGKYISRQQPAKMIYVIFLEERATVKVANEKPAERKKPRETNTAPYEVTRWPSSRLNC